MTAENFNNLINGKLTKNDKLPDLLQCWMEQKLKLKINSTSVKKS